LAELHSHDCVWLVVLAVAGETENAATRAATRAPRQSDARRMMLFSTKSPSVRVASRSVAGLIESAISRRDRVLA
jgi:hypothetical protein